MTRSLRFVLFFSLWLLIAGVLAAACLPESTPSVPPDGRSPTAAPLTPRPPQQTVQPTPAPSTPAGSVSPLTLWVGDDFPLDSAGGQTLWNAAAAFESANPGTRVALLQKKAGGKGGIEDLLGTTGVAVVQALPDIVTVDLRDLPRYARNGLIQPFDASVSPPSDLFPFARLAAQVDSRIYAAPFSADFVHVVYQTDAFKTPPLNWTEVISSGAHYAFATGGESGLAGDAFLTQYVALGGRFADARGIAALDRAPLVDALEQYRTALARGAAVTNTLALRTEEDALKLFLAGKTPLADTTARAFLRERAQLRIAGFAAIPTRDGNLATIARGWGFALVSRDGARRASAQRFAEWLSSADTMAAWNRAAGRVPVRRSALSAWSSDPAYREFAGQMLGVGVSRPVAGAGTTLEVVLQLALVDVLQNNLSATEAADKAISALKR